MLLHYESGITLYKHNLYSLTNLHFFQGTSIIMSHDVINHLLNNQDKIKFDIVDDVSIAMYLRTYLPDVYNCINNYTLPKFTINNYEDDSIFIRNKKFYSLAILC